MTDRTDMQRTQEFLNGFGVGYKIEGLTGDVTQGIILEQGNNKVGGYPGFYTIFEFGMDGKFIKISLFE